MNLIDLRLGRGAGGLVVWRNPYQHLLVLGKSGTGKSALILNMIEQEYYSPFKMAGIILDPSGFLAKDAWSIRKGKAVYSSKENPISLNPMLLPYDNDVKINIMTQSLNQMITRSTPNESLTVAMRGMYGESCKWNMERNRNSLIHVRDIIATLKGSPTAKDGLLARLDFLLGNETMKRMICGSDCLNIPELIEGRKTLILDMHGFSEEQFIFAGTLLLTQIKAHFRYGKVRRYQPLRVYIDEAHNFLTSDILGILMEARKFNFSFVMATVQFSGIDKDIVASLCNVGTIVAFKVGANEAFKLARELDAKPQDLQFPEKYEFHYLTPKNRGKAKALSPPIVIKREPPRGKVEPQRKALINGWFPLESDQEPVRPMSG